MLVAVRHRGEGEFMKKARATVIADDSRVRVTVWEFGPQTATGLHRHEFDYVVVPVSGGTFSVVAPDGSTSEMVQEAAGAYVRTAGAEHDVVNSSDGPASFVEVEIISGQSNDPLAHEPLK
ncbi:MAG: cupin [Actinomycetota bacterium]|nr:cupin [Actinomycetota bacterium]